MKFLLFCLICYLLVLSFLIYCRKFRNPYKLTYIFGKKGSGKSTLMIKYMLKYKKKGWNIYTDIQDCIVPGVRIVNARDLEHFTPDANSALFLDEVGITFDSRDFKHFPKGLRDWFKFERKYKVVCFQNSQSYDVDKKIRDCVDGMILQTSLFDVIGISRPIVKSVTLTAPSAESESRVAEQLKFASIFRWRFMWMPKYHQYFDSFNAPPRGPIPFREVTQEMFDAKQQLRKLNRSLRRNLARKGADK